MSALPQEPVKPNALKACLSAARAYPLSLLLAPFILYGLWEFTDWAIIRAVFVPDLAACGQANAGACWGVIGAKFKVIVFGRYPSEEAWRAAIFVLVWTSLSIVGLGLRVKGPVLWGLGLLALLSLAVLAGGWLNLPSVPSSQWGGLVLTLLLSLLSFGLAFPLAVLLALGRQSRRAWVSKSCAAYIETLRALPLVAVLFLAAFVAPLYLPGDGLSLVPRVVLTLAFFAAAYLAEVVRGGLQVVPRGQAESANALGLGYWQTQYLIVLPQAIKACLPSLVNSFVTLFKECSLVSIVSLFELTGALSLALGGDVQWRPYYLEGYLFVAALYWVYCYSIGKSISKTAV